MDNRKTEGELKQKDYSNNAEKSADFVDEQNGAFFVIG